MFWSWIYFNHSEETYTIHMSDLSGDNLESLVNTDDVPGIYVVCVYNCIEVYVYYTILNNCDFLAPTCIIIISESQYRLVTTTGTHAPITCIYTSSKHFKLLDSI